MPQPGLLLGGPERAGFKPIWRLLFSLGYPEGNQAETCSAQAHELSLRMEAGAHGKLTGWSPQEEVASLGLCQEAVGACTGNWFRTARQAQMRRDCRAGENKALWHDMLAKRTNPAANADGFQLLFLRPGVNVWLKTSKGFYFPYHLTYSLEKENIYITSEVLNRACLSFSRSPLSISH